MSRDFEMQVHKVVTRNVLNRIFPATTPHAYSRIRGQAHLHRGIPQRRPLFDRAAEAMVILGEKPEPGPRLWDCVDAIDDILLSEILQVVHFAVDDIMLVHMRALTLDNIQVERLLRERVSAR